MDDRHPKRRKDKDNPYNLSIENGKCYLSFKDGQGKDHKIEIDRALYDVFDAFELEDLVMLNKRDRHIERSELTDAALERRSLHSPEPLIDEVHRHMLIERLYDALDKLPSIQRRRVELYYFYGLTYEQIAQVEGCSIHSVFSAIQIAKKFLRNFLKLM